MNARADKQRAPLAPARVAEIKRKHGIATKLTVGSAHDELEHEADRVATEVVGYGEKRSAPASLGGAATAPAVQPKTDPVKPRPLLDDEHKKKHDEPAVQRHGGAGAFEAGPRFESLLEGGGGHPLSGAERAFFEPRLGTDLGGVRIHDDTRAAAAAREIDAQAFTRGRDVYFAAGQYQPHTDAGRWLLAHELAHTVQQTGGARRKTNELVQRVTQKPAPGAKTPNKTDAPAPPPAVDATKPRLGPKIANSEQALYIPVLHIPKFKAERYPTSRTYYRSHKFSRKGENDAEQVSRWNQAMGADAGTVAALKPLVKDKHTYIVTGTQGLRAVIADNIVELAARLRRPFWDKAGSGEITHDVDHVVELQIGGWPDAPNRAFLATPATNLELLESKANSASGSTIAKQVDQAVASALRTKQVLDALPPKHRSAEAVFDNYDVVFEKIEALEGSSKPSRWPFADVLAGRHIATLELDSSHVGLFDLSDPNPEKPLKKHRWTREELIGSSKVTVIYVAGLMRVPIRWNPKDQKRQLTPGEILALGFPPGARIEMDVGSKGGADLNQPLGVLTPDELWRYPRTKIGVTTPIGERRQFTIRRLEHTVHAWAMRVPGLANAQGHFGPLSPIEFGALDFDGRELYLPGRIKPSLSVLEKLPVNLVFRGNSVALETTFGAEDLNVPKPFTVPRARVTLGVNQNLAFYADGRVEFGIERVGSGSLSAKGSTEGGFELDGDFTFEKKLAESSIRFWYKKNEWGASGTLTIPSKRVPGVKHATLAVSYAQGKLIADGDAELDVPLFKRAALHLEYSEKDGLVLGGVFELKTDLSIVKSGTLAAEVRRSPEGDWALSGNGRVLVEIAGHRAELKGAYDRGIIDVSARVPFKWKRIDGEVTLGATNREYDKDGKPTGKIAPSFHAYGGGIVTVFFTDWLFGTIELVVLPNGSWHVVGEVGIAETVKITKEPLLDKKIPIGRPIDLDFSFINLGVASLYVKIGGSLEAFARLDPLELRKAFFRVKYNPEKEDETSVVGAGILALPATVGLTAELHLGVGGRVLVFTAEIVGHVSVTAALKLLAELGAGFEWRPGKGIVLAGYAALTAQAELTFRVFATFDVNLDLWLYTKNLYHHDFGGKELSYKPPLRVGAMFPFTYREGQPFDVDIHDIKFVEPDFDREATMKEMFNHARKEDGPDHDNS